MFVVAALVAAPHHRRRQARSDEHATSAIGLCCQARYSRDPIPEVTSVGAGHKGRR